MGFRPKKRPCTEHPEPITFMSLFSPESPMLEQYPAVFADLPENFRRQIWESGTIKDYVTGRSISGPSDPGEYVRVLMSGSAAVIMHCHTGHDICVENIDPGELVGEVSFLTGRPSPQNSEVVALEPCRVLELPSTKFENIIRANPDCAIAVMRHLACKVIKLDENIFKNISKKRALQTLISRQDHLFPDYFVSETVRRRVGRRLEELANSGRPILITGETGVGKEFLAHAIYGLSPYHERVFLCLDLLRPLGHVEPAGNFCELPEEVSDPTEEQTKWFFGYETLDENGIRVETPGYLELTEEGTLVVRGMEQLTPEVQEKLLVTLKTGKYRRYGSEKDLIADLRLIGTTNLDLSEISDEKHPLLYWLLDNSLSVPPLRKRRKEIPTLVDHYAKQYCQELHKEVKRIPKETLKALVSYSWPGNDVELATTLKRAVLLSEDGIIRPNDIYFDLRSIETEGKINLLRMPILRSAFRSPLFPAIFQSAAAPFFFILLVLLFLGPADPVKNVGGVFSWAVGWPTMVFGSFLWARFWCSLCPMGTLSVLAKKIVALEIPLPLFVKRNSDWFIAASALFIIWLETATNIRSSPFNTGLLLVSIFLLAVVISVIFEKQSWCRYLCPLGGMMGVFAKTSPFELRADRHVCASQCTSNECYVGTSSRPGCPFGQMVPTLRSNRFCKLCGTCIKNCPHSGVNLNLRIPGREIWEIKQTGAITAFLVISMFGGLLSDLFHKTSFYLQFSAYLPSMPRLLSFTVFFLVIIGLTNLLVWAASAISSRSTGDTIGENFAKYGLSLLPLVLTGYMAFHLYYLINYGVYFPIIMWETFHFEIFRQLVITVSPVWTSFFQKFLVWIGLIGTLVIAFKLASGKSRRMSDVLLEFLPHGIAAVVLTMTLLHAITVGF